MPIDTDGTSNVYYLPIGVDFAVQLKNGILRRFEGAPPEDLARLTIFVNTRRSARRLHDLFIQEETLLIPKIRVLADITKDANFVADLPPQISSLGRRLLMGQAVRKLLLLEKGLGSLSSTYDLADSLANLLDEFQGEGIEPEKLNSAVADKDLTGHWQRSQKFLNIMFEKTDPNKPTDAQGRMRFIASMLGELWKDAPPKDPILIAGSTGSRGATRLLMKAVSALPNGAIVLPGFDKNLTALDWENLAAQNLLDHPQAMLAQTMDALDVRAQDVSPWTDCDEGNSEQHKLISAALLPAPVTDRWLSQKPELSPHVLKATQALTLLEAESPAIEALAIAAELRSAVHRGQKAALITPDASLARRVNACLGRWKIKADDSKGEPLQLSPAGIFSRLVSECVTREVSFYKLSALLKHPVCQQGENRNTHLLSLRKAEINFFRGRNPSVDFDALCFWAENQSVKDDELIEWCNWLRSCFLPLSRPKDQSVAEWVRNHKGLCERLAGEIEVWKKGDAIKLFDVFEKLSQSTDLAGRLDALGYSALFNFALSQEEVREAVTVHPDVVILGTLEARVQSAELVILAGLNEDTWPKHSRPDPWLNRQMRSAVGLPLPERQIGLSAHDFQQGAGAKQVILSRSLRDADAPQIPSRWIARLENLLSGLGDNGISALEKMRERGDNLCEIARELNRVTYSTPKESRPSPAPPSSARPNEYYATQIPKLTRDPYSIYASKILRLYPLNPFRASADALERGTALHDVMEAFNLQSDWSDDAFLQIAEDVLTEKVNWPAARLFWLQRLRGLSSWLGAEHRALSRQSEKTLVEQKGGVLIPELGIRLSAKADRIDVNSAGGLTIIDYKAGDHPTASQVYTFEKQLPITAAIAMRGGFKDIIASHVLALSYIQLKDEGNRSDVPLQKAKSKKDPSIDLMEKTWPDIIALLGAYSKKNKGFTARDRPKLISEQYGGDYDHLSRRGEWNDADSPVFVPVGSAADEH